MRAPPELIDETFLCDPPRSLVLEDGFRFLEDRDLERVPVTEGGRLVGVLSRAVVQRRLAEDNPPPDDDEPLG